MKADRPSRTAHFVALGRAFADAGLSHVPGFRDPTARVFLSEKGRRSFARTQQAQSDTARSYKLEMARAMADMIALRTSTIDAAVREAIEGGVKQLVIVGAGYDGRAWRMSELAGVRVFEVDHPATQTEKRDRMSALPPSIAEIHFVSVNFERESIGPALERAGHDRATPTCWIWEGVVMYLTREAMRATLAGIAERSAPGSTLIVNYHQANRRLVARLILRLIGEPQISAWTPEEMNADLHTAGFAVREDTGMLDWNQRFAQSQARVRRAWYMRVAVAGRQS